MIPLLRFSSQISRQVVYKGRVLVSQTKFFYISRRIDILLYRYSKSPHIRTYFFESQAEIGSYFKDAMTNIRVDMFLFEERLV